MQSWQTVTPRPRHRARPPVQPLTHDVHERYDFKGPWDACRCNASTLQWPLPRASMPKGWLDAQRPWLEAQRELQLDLGVTFEEKVGAGARA